ncbi:site-specific DNA-methyltransferase [Acetobacteraceae bacterium]|nr:site-specific DNA-methyltransferase [Acetobacteraceae bacterium]
MSPTDILADDFLLFLKKFSVFGRETECFTEGDIPYFQNEFWTSKQRQDHSLHRISYRGCFKAQLPEFFITHLTEQGDFVFDPFMGRGTTLLQAHLMGRRVGGNDLNPLSALLCRPRLNPPTLEETREALNKVPWEKGRITQNELRVFYHPKTLKHLEALRVWTKKNAPQDPVADWIRMVALNRLTGHSEGFFSVRSMPPSQAISLKSQRRLNQQEGIDPRDKQYLKNIPEIILRKSHLLLKDGRPPKAPLSEPLFLNKNSWNLREIPSETVDLIVTSPPFLDTLHYRDDNWLRCWFAGRKSEKIKIPMQKTPKSWQEMIQKTLKEQERILKRGGFLALEVGEIRHQKIQLEKLVWEAAENLSFKRLGVMINQQNFNKTATCWGIQNNEKGTNSNRIVLLQKHPS